MIERTDLTNQVKKALTRAPVVALLGPRQCGKSTLAGEIARETRSTAFDLEKPVDLSHLEQPLTALEPLRGLVILDEIQRRTDILPVLRVLADRRPKPARFLLLGSASPELVRNSSESLAGRIEFVEMGGFTLGELPLQDLSRRWLRGGLPRSYLARSEMDSCHWREAFIQTFLERDLPLSLDIRIPPVTLHRFWMMLAHYHGQVWNSSEIARSMGLSDKTVKHYLDLLTGSFMVRQLQPWYANVGKRQVKSPKIYFRDTGLLHTLLGLPDKRALMSNPRLGASWEGFMLEQVLVLCKPRDAFFWGTHGGGEIDLIFQHRGEMVGVEFKFADAPRLEKSMIVTYDTLNLKRLFVIYPGKKRYPLAPNIEAWPACEITELANALT